MLREKDAARLKRLRRDMDAARERKRKALDAARAVCAANRQSVSDSAKARRAALSEQIAAERAQARGSCSAGRVEARESGNAALSKARGELKAERAALRTERIYKQPPKLGANASGAGAKRAAELRAESDSEVRNNLDPSLVPVWEKMKRHIRATGRMTRTEAFLQYLHDNPHVVWEIQEADAARELRRLEREHHQQHKASRHPKRYRRSPEALAASLADVPF